MTIRGVLFDKDGTLLDFEQTWLPVLKEAARVAAGEDELLAGRLLEAGGYQVENDRVLPGSVLAAGNTAELCGLWSEFLPAGRSDDLVAKVDRVFAEGGARHAVAVTELAPLFLGLKNRGMRLGVATNDGETAARASLAHFDILEHLDFLAGYDSGFGAKPEPGMVSAFCQAVDLKAEAVAVVGDNIHDLEMGRRAGVGLKIAVLTGGASPKDLTSLADYIVPNIEHLEQVLDNHHGK